MELTHQALLFLHLLGMGSVFGGLLVQVKSEPRVVNNAMLHGVLTQVVTGVLLVGVLESGDDPVNHAKVGVKLVLGLVLAVLILLNRKKSALSDGIFYGLLAGIVVTVGTAVFW